MLPGVQQSQSFYFLKFLYLKPYPLLKNISYLFPYVEEALSYPKQPDMDPH